MFLKNFHKLKISTKKSTKNETRVYHIKDINKTKDASLKYSFKYNFIVLGYFL